MRTFRPTILRALLGAALASAALAPAADAAPWFGFNDGSVAFNQLTPSASASLAKSAGSTADNIVVSWRDVEPTQGDLRWTVPDGVYNARVAKGIRPIFTVMYAPRWTWASDVSCSGDCRYPPAPAYDGAWRSFITALAKRYPQLAGIQVWNEPNLTTFWQSATDPVRYTDLVKQAKAGVAAAGAAIPVVAGAVANIRDGDSRGMHYRSFLKASYDAGLKGNADGIAVHPYPIDIDMWSFYGTLSDVREIRDAAGDSATKLWITEVGVTTTAPLDRNFPFNENSQAIMDARMVQKLRTMPDVAAITLHTLVEPTIFPTSDPEFGYGIVRPQPNLVRKPAYCEIAKLNATGYRCPSSVAKVTPIDTQQNLRWQAQDLLQAAADGARAYRAQTGSYYGLTPALLRTYAPAVSATPGSTTTPPGSTADPSRMVIWAPYTGPSADLWLCNTSKADRSYCIWLTPDRSWTYGHANGPVSEASRSTAAGTAWW
jgi:hypothetical protein